VMKGMEKDLGTELEWVAVAHHNTEHPHVHVALRGVRSDMQPLHSIFSLKNEPGGGSEATRR
jgi:type IV secretory pathway VirD2 relaxase